MRAYQAYYYSLVMSASRNGNVKPMVDTTLTGTRRYSRDGSGQGKGPTRRRVSSVNVTPPEGLPVPTA